MAKKKSKDPPKIFKIRAALRVNKPLRGDDDRYVETEKARCNSAFTELLNLLCVDKQDNVLYSPPNKSYILFFGQMGSGKTTELNRFSNYLRRHNLFFVVFLDFLGVHDDSTLHLKDLMQGIAFQLKRELEENKIRVDRNFRKKLNKWSSEVIIKEEKVRESSIGVEGTVGAGNPVSFILKFLVKALLKIKWGTTHKRESQRKESISPLEFATEFNELVKHSEEKIKKVKKGQKLLFIVDGTDRLNLVDGERLFIGGAGLLRQIEANLIFSAPSGLKFTSKFPKEFKQLHLPMIKTCYKDSNEKYEEGYKVLKEIIYKRVDNNLFENDEALDLLIKNSGGHPVDLLNLLHRMSLIATNNFCTRDVEGAIKILSEEYRRFLNPEDYEILFKIDSGETVDKNSDQIHSLYKNTAILEYFSESEREYWWRSHPLIHRLKEYQEVKHAKRI